MDRVELMKLMRKYHVVTIILLIILVFYMIMIFTTPAFSDEMKVYDNFNVTLPTDAEINDIDGGIKILGPADEYRSEIYSTDDANKLYSEALQELNLEGYDPYVESYNDTHDLVIIEVFGALPSDTEILYMDYDFFIPKDAYNESTYELKDTNATVGVIKTYDINFNDYLLETIKFGG